MQAESIIKRWKDATTAGDYFRGLYEWSYRLACPNHNNWDNSPGSNKSYRIYNSSTSMAMDGFVNTMMNTITPVHTRWADLTAGVGMISKYFQLIGYMNPDKEEIAEAEHDFNELLGDLTESIFNYLNASNLYSALGSMYYDVGIGTGFLLAMPGNENIGLGGPLNFRAFSPKWMAIEEGAYGEISAVFRKIKQKYRDAKVEWKDMKEMDQIDDNSLLDFVEATIFNHEINMWCYYVLHGNTILVEREYRSNPWIVFRWDLINGEVWGRGPMTKAMPDAMQLNATTQLAMRANQLSAFGCFTGISDDIVNPDMVRIVPGAIIPVKRNAGPSGPTLAPLPQIGNLNAQLMNIQELEGKIRHFLLDDRLPPSENNPKMTATEVMERVRKIQRDFGSVFGRISYELLQPILQRAIDILIYDKGLINLPQKLADVFSKIDGFSLKLKVISPLARMQGMQDVEALIQTIQMLGNISPELMQEQIKMDELGEWLADKLGAPAKFIRSPEELKQLRDQKQQQLMQQQLELQQQEGNQAM